MYEYDIIAPQTKNGLKVELNKRTADGWEFVAVYAAAMGQIAHVIMRRPKP